VHRWRCAVLALAEQVIHRHLIALGHGDEVRQRGSRYLDHLHDARRDLRHADTARVAEGQEDLDGLRAGRGCAHAAASSMRATTLRTSILPVTAAEIRAVRRSWSRAMVDSAS